MACNSHTPIRFTQADRCGLAALSSKRVGLASFSCVITSQAAVQSCELVHASTAYDDRRERQYEVVRVFIARLIRVFPKNTSGRLISRDDSVSAYSSSARSAEGNRRRRKDSRPLCPQLLQIAHLCNHRHSQYKGLPMCAILVACRSLGYANVSYPDQLFFASSNSPRIPTLFCVQQAFAQTALQCR
jgi:hypothetical protein